MDMQFRHKLHMSPGIRSPQSMFVAVVEVYAGEMDIGVECATSLMWFDYEQRLEILAERARARAAAQLAEESDSEPKGPLPVNCAIRGEASGQIWTAPPIVGLRDVKNCRVL